MAQCFGAVVLSCLGYPDQSGRLIEEALILTPELAHPHSQAFALGCAAKLAHYRSDKETVLKHAQATCALSTEQGFPFWVAWGMIFQGWAGAELGRKAEGIAQIRAGLATYHTTECVLWLPYFLAVLAEAYGRSGQAEEGLSVLAEAVALVDRNQERFYEAELHRLRGELLIEQAQKNEPEGEAAFQQALVITRQQEAKSWELRAATSLARLWHSQGKTAEARDLLAPIYGWFTEGFDTADLKDAKALLSELSEEQ